MNKKEYLSRLKIFVKTVMMFWWWTMVAETQLGKIWVICRFIEPDIWSIWDRGRRLEQVVSLPLAPVMILWYILTPTDSIELKILKNWLINLRPDLK